MNLESDSVAYLELVSRAVGYPATHDQIAQLLAFERILATEGLAAGAIGPHEPERLLDRHIADSMAYLVGIRIPVDSVVDVGSGIGLPGIPLAIMLPEAEFVLVERSQTRADLARRAARVLKLANVSILNLAIQDVETQFDMAVFRASVGIPPAAEIVRAQTKAHGYGLFGVSRMSEPPTIPEPPEGIAYELSENLVGVLDSPFWLLRMAHI